MMREISTTLPGNNLEKTPLAVTLPGTQLPPPLAHRVQGRGKFIFAGAQKLYVRGVAYAPLGSDDRNGGCWNRTIVERDLERIAEQGFNAVRVYTLPPQWLLQFAQQHELKVMVGLAWEQHVNFLKDKRRRSSIAAKIRAGVRSCEGHPAVLCFAIGNEIASDLVRWHGRTLERFLDDLCHVVKEEDPEALVTYVNFPTTEYLRLSTVDLMCFNVYLEHQAAFERYLARLHNLAGDRPLLMTEIGLDSRRHGCEKQAQVLDWQIRTSMASGCAGAFVFGWTDEWHRGGERVTGWEFGLTTADRTQKPSLQTVREAFADAPFPGRMEWPLVSVVVCTYNGARTLWNCLSGLQKLDYPNFEVIIVDDGSSDSSAAVASQFRFRLIQTPNQGLSAARNTGWRAASGEIIAYLDDDAHPDPQWLKYLVSTFQKAPYAAVGGPNVPPPGGGLVAQCISHAPGGPIHVLLSDQIAEHIPGCNMALRRECLEAVGGFDPQFRVAGDDVDICWRMQKKGQIIGFSPGAMVWHQRRQTIEGYWKQQNGYGKAEALLERKWPEKYNAAGHVTWSGRLYGGNASELFSRSRVYHGVWGCAPFQSVYPSGPLGFLALPATPEWWLVIAALVALTTLGMLWKPLLWTGVLVGIALLLPVAEAASKALSVFKPATRDRRMARFFVTLSLYLLQPLARLIGRLRHGLTVWRHRGPRNFWLPRPKQYAVWSEGWQSSQEWLLQVEQLLRGSGTVVLEGGVFDRWDLEVRGGVLGAARSAMLIEEHGNGRQYLKFKIWPRFRMVGLVPFFPLAFLGCMAGIEHALIPAIFLGIAALSIILRTFRECAWAQAAFKIALLQLERTQRNNSPR